MSGQHTPGPWFRGHFTGSVKLGSKDRHKLIASVYGDDPSCMPDDRMYANARLIAAAPDLLEALNKARAALKEQLEFLIQCHSDPATGLITDDADLLAIESDQDLINSIDAAIAKATEAA